MPIVVGSLEEPRESGALRLPDPFRPPRTQLFEAMSDDNAHPAHRETATDTRPERADRPDSPPEKRDATDKRPDGAERR